MECIKKTFCVILFLSVTAASHAGIKWVEIGVNGLTCSLCTGSVERSVRRLEFVEKVSMSLENTSGRIYFKDDAVIDLKRIAKAVRDSGFSVRFLRVNFDFDEMNVGANGIFTFQGQSYQWMQFKNRTVKGDVVLQLIDEGFLPKKEGTEMRKKLGALAADNKVYHVAADQ